ncbi:MAG: 6-bladed beta-propeller [Tannerellaceae bacterium]|jgi:hypothetical protein|nr:6-bladed beta-propeller [Tannerellaceae bacterium]
MKKQIAYTASILLATAGFGGCKSPDIPNDGVVTVDVTANYPKKELILQDFMDVEYIALETDDAFVTQASVLTVGTDVIVVRNYANDGDIFIFDRKTGQAIKKINHRGQGAEEYTAVVKVVLDEDRGEMFVADFRARRIQVYDMDGNYKRSLKHKEDAACDQMYNFDRDNLICHDGFYTDEGEANRQSFMIISKQDGRTTQDIQIPFEKKILSTVIMKDEANNMTWSAKPYSHFPLLPYLDDLVIVEESSDTVYLYSPDHAMTPLMVRTPPIGLMEQEVFLFPSVLTDRYYFMETSKKEFDLETSDGFPGTSLVFDRQEGAIFESVLYNDDFSDKTPFVFGFGRLVTIPFNREDLAFIQKLESFELVEALREGKLKGALKEIASGLDEESNPVIMLVKPKK